MYLHKNGIVLRKACENDLSAMLALKNESWLGTHRISILNMQDQRAWFERISHSPTDLILVAESEYYPFGLYKIQHIDWISRACDIGYDVYAEWRNQGFGKRLVEAGVDFGFDVLNMRRVSTEVLSNNHASLKCARAAGFHEEGVRRNAVVKYGVEVDSILFGLLREDWRAFDRVQQYGGLCNSSYQPKNHA